MHAETYLDSTGALQRLLGGVELSNKRREREQASRSHVIVTTLTLQHVQQLRQHVQVEDLHLNTRIAENTNTPALSAAAAASTKLALRIGTLNIEVHV